MIPVNESLSGGGLIQKPGQLQFGPMLLGADTSAGWRSLAGWRDLPEASLGDSPRPQAHGDYPGSVFGGPVVVTFTFMLRGGRTNQFIHTDGQKLADLETIERWTQLTPAGQESWLAVNDGEGTWMRRARVIGRNIPQEVHFSHAPLECSIQFLCADPRRYWSGQELGMATLASGSGGLVYPLVYPLTYGTQSTGSMTAYNTGTADAPFTATFNGPLTNPRIVSSDGWELAFNITLAGGEQLVVNTAAGTALLNGTADRMIAIANDSDPVDACALSPGDSTLTLTAAAGSGTVQVLYRPTRM